ncbi:FAD-dependent oxidoreductase [Saccharopolyspora phatthalungensis]|uniref:Glycine/D-amino acid oxidase-like deaminating enzyme/nitrite reductase/ring-hydroxylating ferredoxin subunit n=1 Tax=Saccharopolyspora phatthalungensis TaxID=664693 RepID=A0A840QF48_9PSEU|nr:FAD-dependent oxidoreductase [Saccharopolyspora phatthalungensis]MBB5158677.1 glycine/D-amino acid oxidase-like deaminating enzyme/nitrite reductase/ring-hydroxylating ferredoxin subunit [Saccharopolyspora phatthalungensis]
MTTHSHTARNSPWTQAQRPEYPVLRGRRSFDVAVIGGGITGLTTALLLKRQGARVAVVEADRVASGATGNNTAKATALQSTMYTTIREHRSRDAAQVYAAASTAAVEKIAELATEESIACGLGRQPAYTYAVDDAGMRAVETEAEAAREAGLPVLADETPDLPFPVMGALRLDGQIEFDPVRYALGLAELVHGDESAIFEQSRALRLTDGSPCRINTAFGSLTADQVVVATHSPVLDRGLHFARLKVERSYCIAARLRGVPPRGLSINAGRPVRSLRSHGSELIVCGEGHPTGARGIAAAQYGRLEEFARTHWDVEEITHRWSAQDPTSYDHFPMVGAAVPFSSRLFVATGFMKWGLTGGTFAAMVLTDLLDSRDNPWAASLSPNRFSPASWWELAQINFGAGVDFVSDRLTTGNHIATKDVVPGVARVIRHGTDFTGVYRDEDGLLHCVSLRCTHLGCLLRFNGAERSWDCPCHGSRFDVDGAVLEGPAVQPLEVKTPPESEH